MKKTVKSRIGALTLACVMTLGILPMQAYAAQDVQKKQSVKIGLLSDTHYFSKSLYSDCEDFTIALNSDRKMLKESDAILTSALNDLVRDEPDFVLISGDLTKDGEQVNHEALAKKLTQAKKELAEKGVDTDFYVIDGNHDINNAHGKDFSSGHAVDADRTTVEEFKKIYQDFGYGKDSVQYSPNGNRGGSLSYVTRPAEGYTLIAVDSSKYSSDQTASGKDIQETGGVIGKDLLRWVTEQAREAKKRGDIVLVMQHHGVVPHFGMEPTVMADYLVDNWQEVETAYADAGVSYVFTGHMHANDVASYTSPSGNVLCDIETGSLLTYPSLMREAEIEPGSTASDYSSIIRVETKKPQNVRYTDFDTGELVEIADITEYGKAHTLSNEVIKTMIAKDVLEPMFQDALEKGGSKALAASLLGIEDAEQTSTAISDTIAGLLPTDKATGAELTIAGFTFSIYYDAAEEQIKISQITQTTAQADNIMEFALENGRTLSVTVPEELGEEIEERIEEVIAEQSAEVEDETAQTAAPEEQEKQEENAKEPEEASTAPAAVPEEEKENMEITEEPAELPETSAVKQEESAEPAALTAEMIESDENAEEQVSEVVELAAEPAEENEVSTEETNEPAEEPAAPAEEFAGHPEEPAAPAEELADPTEEPVAPVDENTVLEEKVVPAEENAELTEKTKEPDEAQMVEVSENDARGLFDPIELFIRKSSVKNFLDDSFRNLDEEFLAKPERVSAVVDTLLDQVLNAGVDETHTVFDLVNYVYQTHLAGDEACEPWAEAVIAKIKEQPLLENILVSAVQNTQPSLENALTALTIDLGNLVEKGNSGLATNVAFSTIIGMFSNAGDLVNMIDLSSLLSKELLNQINELAYNVAYSMSHDDNCPQDNKTAIKISKTRPEITADAQQALDQAGRIEQENYTAASYQNMKDAAENLENTLNKGSVEDISKAITALYQAVEALEDAPAGPSPEDKPSENPVPEPEPTPEVNPAPEEKPAEKPSESQNSNETQKPEKEEVSHLLPAVDAPKTGDTEWISVSVLVALAAVSGTAVLLLLYKKYKKENHEA